MVKTITTCMSHAEPHYLVCRCDDYNNVAKEITTMNVGSKKPLRPSSRCMDRLRLVLKELQVDPKPAQKME